MVRIIEVTTPTCGKCKMLKGMLEFAMKGFAGKAELIVLDGTADDEAKQVIEKYNVNAVPFFVFQKDGSDLDTHEGTIDIGTFKNKINALI